jgi:hypothetical protein
MKQPFAGVERRQSAAASPTKRIKLNPHGSEVKSV